MPRVRREWEQTDALKTGLDDVQMVPANSRKRLDAMVGSRSKWCISRQRVWGVPIPAFYSCAGEHDTEEVITMHLL